MSRILSTLPAKSTVSFRAGFTLIEILVCMAILTLMVTFLSQIVSQTGVVTGAVTKHLNNDSQARVVFDTIGANLSTMLMSANVVPVVVKNANSNGAGRYNDALAVINNGRPRTRSIVTQDSLIRMTVMGYKVRSVADPLLGDSNVPMLNWGDGTISWGTADGAAQDMQQAKSDFLKVLSAVAADLTDPDPANDETMVAFESIGVGIFRFEVSFLLDDGTIISQDSQVPNGTPIPRNKNISITGTNVFAIALSPDDVVPTVSTTTGVPQRRYVRALIIGIAGLDIQTRQLVGNEGSQLASLADALPKPKFGQTPLQAWDFTSETADAKALAATLAQFPRPVLNALRFYQRYYYVH